jgi:CcmD family protein
VSDVGFVIAAYAVILGGIGVYTAFLIRRLRVARETLDELRRAAGAAPSTTDERR